MHRTATRRLDSHRSRLKSTRRASGSGLLVQPLQTPAAAAACLYQPGLAHGHDSSSSAGPDPLLTYGHLDTIWSEAAAPPWVEQPSNSLVGAWSCSAQGPDDHPLSPVADGTVVEPLLTPTMSVRPYSTPQQQQQQQPEGNLHDDLAATPQPGLHNAAAQAWQQEASSSIRSSLELYSRGTSTSSSSSGGWQDSQGGSQSSSFDSWGRASNPGQPHGANPAAQQLLPPPAAAGAAGWLFSIHNPATYTAAGQQQQQLALSMCNGTGNTRLPAAATGGTAAAVAAAAGFAGGSPACICCYPPALAAGHPCEVRMYLNGPIGALPTSAALPPPSAAAPPAAALLAAAAHMVPYHVAMWQGGGLVTEVTGECCSDATMISLSIPPLPEGPLTLQLQLNSTTNLGSNSPISSSSSSSSSSLITQQLLVLPEAAAADLTDHWAKLVQQALRSSAVGLPACASMTTCMTPSSWRPDGTLWVPCRAAATPFGTETAASTAKASQQSHEAWQQWLEAAGQLQPAAVQSAWHKQYMPLVNDIAAVTTWGSNTTSSSSSNSSAPMCGANSGQQHVLTKPRLMQLLAAVVEALTAAGLWALLQHVTDCVYGVGAAAKALYTATSSGSAARATAGAGVNAGCDTQRHPQPAPEAATSKQAAAADDHCHTWSGSNLKIGAGLAEDCQSVQPPSPEASLEDSSSGCSNLSVRTPSEASTITCPQASGSNASLYPPSCSSKSSGSLVGSENQLLDLTSRTSSLSPACGASTSSSHGTADCSGGSSSGSGNHWAPGPRVTAAADHSTGPASIERPLLPIKEGAAGVGSSQGKTPTAAAGPHSTQSMQVSAALRKDMTGAVVRVLCLLGVLAAVAWLGGAS